MTDEIEYVAPEDSTVVDTSGIEQKLNEAFEQKLNERDTKIAELSAIVEEFVQKQNAAEAEAVAKQAEADFVAFRMQLNQANNTDELAKQHYDAFKEQGFAYLAANPGIREVVVPKQNARGVPSEDGSSASGLSQARALLKETQKQNARRAH